ncbi:MAG: SMC-Scp complex subunit ScpB [Armatimonadota bacterium]
MELATPNLQPETLRGLHAVLECLLFVASEPVTAEQVGAVLDLEPELAGAALEDMRRHYTNGGGLHVVRVAGGYQLRTRPEFASVISTFLRPPAQKLSRQALETLAIVAYEQPITQPEIDALRGVKSDGVLKTLVERELIEEAGRKDAPGRPILYRTTERFLKHFGLADLTELPRLEVDLGAALSEKQDLSI